MINEKYIIKKKLGQGRSSVFLCEDIDMPEKYIAIKILPVNADEFEKEMFKNEYFTLLRLNHPSIIRPFEYGTIQTVEDEKEKISLGSKFFSLEYYGGTELLKFPLIKDEQILRKIVAQICSVLYYLHLSNYIYYDLKPENVLVSLVNGQPLIKVIDLGFAQNILDNSENVVRGTAEYIAPEILKSERHDSRVDFYSLGMVLYRIIYNGFPFNTTNELDIYKAQIEKEFEFNKVNYSEELIKTIKKLLQKNPSDRYNNALEILEDLNVPIDDNLSKDWLPANIFSNRKDSLTILKTYISDDSSSEVFSIRGSEGAGKTSLAYELYSNYENAVFISNNTSLTGIKFIRFSVNKIIFNDFIFSKLNPELLKSLSDTFNNPTDLVNKLKSFFSQLSTTCSFIIIFDAFNSYDDYTIEIWKNIIPILQVNKIKVILTENSDKHFIANFIHNLREVNLTPFTEAHLAEYLEKRFPPFFPKNELKRLILSYADLLPGNIESFIRDIIFLKILTFTPRGIEIIQDNRTDSILKSSHDEIYNLRFTELSEKEKLISQFTSAFEITVNPNIILKYFDLSTEELFLHFSRLEQKNIIQHVQTNSNPNFVSEGLKRFIYSTIKDKSTFHSSISKFLYANFPDFGSLELARQFELSGNYDVSYEILDKEIKRADDVSAYSYEKNILERLIKFPLSTKTNLDIKIKLANIYFKLSQYQSSINLIDLIFKETKDLKSDNDLLFLKARCFIGLTEFGEGKNIIESLLPKVKDNKKKQIIMLELATVEFNLNQYDKAKSICEIIIEDKSSGLEEKGQSYEMLGLISVHKDNNLEKALDYFKKASIIYEKSGLNLQLAQNLMNIGITYIIQGKNKEANIYWKKSLDINRLIGNIEQEAKLLMNYGGYYYKILELDKSIESYEKASSIFTSLGNKKGYALLLINLSEIYIITCDYQKAIDYLNGAINSFKQLENINEELEALYLLGKLNFILGDFENLNNVFKKYKSYAKGNNLSEKHNNYFRFLTILIKHNQDPKHDTLESLSSLRHFFLEEKDYYDYVFITSFLIKNLIQKKSLNVAINILNSEELIEICKGNLIFEAERNYLIGIVVNLDVTKEVQAQINYFNIAYDQISNTYITELTWEILYSLTKAYSERGNLKKALEFGKYALSLINFIAENIKDYRLRNIYLEKEDRKEAIEKLNSL